MQTENESTSRKQFGVSSFTFPLQEFCTLANAKKDYKAHALYCIKLLEGLFMFASTIFEDPSYLQRSNRAETKLLGPTSINRPADEETKPASSFLGELSL